MFHWNGRNNVQGRGPLNQIVRELTRDLFPGFPPLEKSVRLRNEYIIAQRAKTYDLLKFARGNSVVLAMPLLSEIDHVSLLR